MSILVGRKAPEFTVPAVLASGEIVPKFSLADEIKDKYALVFFYPLDFTFVCPTELIALNSRMAEFEKRDVAVIAVSIDSQFTHSAWRNTDVKDGGIGKVNYTMAADVNHAICRAYGVEHPDVGVAFRGAFVIDKKGIVRAQIVNDLPIGRDLDEILRLVDAVQYNDEHGEVCPAGWRKGKEAMKPSTAGVASYLGEHASEL